MEYKKGKETLESEGKPILKSLIKYFSKPNEYK